MIQSVCCSGFRYSEVCLKVMGLSHITYSFFSCAWTNVRDIFQVVGEKL